LGLATSHVAFITQSPEMGDPQQVEGFSAGYRRLAQALRDARPDAVLVVSGEHLNYFFIDNMPAFCIGVADGFEGPTERGAGVPFRRIPGAVAFANYLLTSGLDAGVDWARTEGWELDHGIMVPHYLLDADGRFPVAPMFINCAAPPCPTARRCYAVGEWLRESIRRWDATKRVAIVATGGLSHSVGTESMGRIDEAFDRRFLEMFCKADRKAIAGLSEDEIMAAGNSTSEIRSWIVLGGAFAGRPAELVFYAPIKGFATGCGQVVIQ
jgi:aromatic ring-opening dioxygenase catalytic subunit (LigB family)